MVMNKRDDKPIILTEQLSRKFDSVTAVESLDLKVERGEMFGLVGPDGAGKSTAIRVLCGILKPTGGKGEVLGYDLTRESEQIKGRIGYLSQSFTLYGDLTIDENIEFFADLHGVKGFKNRRDELLDFTRLSPFRKRLAQSLSGGMKKKLALACTLIHTPDLIFLDEPSTGVDPVSRGEFWNILSGILEQGVTIFMTTPYLDEAERCHRIGLMHKGRILMTGSPEEIKARMPGQIYNLECERPAEAYKALREIWPSTRVVLYGDRLHFWTPEGETELKKASAHVADRGLGPVRSSQTTPSLEDAFVAMVGQGESHE
jgi:ABC-2 type transport system ATP-binding protein